MRSTQTCPKCAGKKFAVTPDFLQPHHEFPGNTHPFPPITIALQRESWNKERMTFGRFEVWICVGCGYTEFYAHGIEDIEQIADQYPDQWRIVDAGPAQGPYR